MWMLKAAATFLFLLQFVHFHMCTEGVWFKLWQPAYFLLNLSYIHKRSQKGLRQQNKPIIQVPSSHVSTLHCVVFVNKNGKISIRTEWRIRYVVPSLWTTLKHRLNQNHHSMSKWDFWYCEQIQLLFWAMSCVPPSLVIRKFETKIFIHNVHIYRFQLSVIGLLAYL